MTLRYIWAKPDEDGRWVWGVTRGQANMILAGYACGNCLEEFKLNGVPTYMPVCPVCKQETSRELVEVPEEWRVAIEERRAEPEGF